MSLYAYQDAELLNYHIQCNYNRRRLFTAYKLASVKIGNGEYEIDDSCFAYCDSLSKVEISDNAEVEFGSDVFYKCADDLDIAYGKNHYNADTVEDAF